MLRSLVSLFLLVYLHYSHGIEEDNLANALHSIESRQRQLASSYVLPNKDTDRSLRFDDDALMYLGSTPTDYDVPHRNRYPLPKPQKNFRSYEDYAVADPDPEEYQKALNERLLDQLMLDILKNDDEVPDHRPQKKSFFREREINEVSDNLQNLQPDINVDEVLVERLKSKLRSPHRRVSQQYDLENLNEEYLNSVNPLWRKYDGQSIRNVDPESLSSEDIDGFLKYLGSKNFQYDDDDGEYTKELYSSENRNSGRDRSKRYWLGSNQRNLIQKRSLDPDERPRTPKPVPVAVAVQQPENTTSNHTKMANSTESTKTEVKRNKRGQDEIPIDLKSLKPLNIKKKSIDWSNYFGVDKRQKKSQPPVKEPPTKSDVLLDQYIQSYILQSVRNSAFNNPSEGYYPKRGSDIFREMKYEDDKKLETAEDLRTAEDLIIDHVLKYTGAHQGTTDPKELQQYRDRVINELGAAYNLEKLRSAIFEGKQIDSVEKRGNEEHQHSNDKRVAIKKQNAELLPSEMEEPKSKHNSTMLSNHGAQQKNLLSNKYSYEIDDRQINECSLLNEIIRRCTTISINAKDHENIFTSNCVLHNICNICGTKDESIYCDLTFYSDVNQVCPAEDSFCKYTAQQVLADLQSEETKSFVATNACDTCVSELLQISMST